MNDWQKGVAGESQLYEALKIVAQVKKCPEPVLLGEADPVVETVQLARYRKLPDGSKQSFPDCYLRLDDRESLWECKNNCYYHVKGGWGKYHDEFWRQSPEWVRREVKSKAWNEPRYPIRDKARTVWNPQTHLYEREPVYVYTNTNTRDITKFYVGTIPSFLQSAWFDMVEFIGNENRLVFSEHPLLSSDLCEEPEDKECSETAFSKLNDGVLTAVDDNLPKR